MPSLKQVGIVSGIMVAGYGIGRGIEYGVKKVFGKKKKTESEPKKAGQKKKAA